MYTFSCSMLHTLQQTRFKSGEFGGHSTFYNFSVTLNVKMNCTRNYENWFNLVKVMFKIQVVPFFLDPMTLC